MRHRTERMNIDDLIRRKIVTLRTVNRLTYRAIGERFRISIDTARNICVAGGCEPDPRGRHHASRVGSQP